MNESEDLDDYTLYEQINNAILKVSTIDLKDDPEVDVFWVELIDKQESKKLKSHTDTLVQRLEVLKKPKDIPLSDYEELIKRGKALNEEEQELLDTLASYHAMMEAE